MPLTPGNLPRNAEPVKVITEENFIYPLCIEYGLPGFPGLCIDNPRLDVRFYNWRISYSGSCLPLSRGINASEILPLESSLMELFVRVKQRPKKNLVQISKYL